MPVFISVLMATRNGARVLPRVLEGYCRAVPPADPWQMIIVDNGSTDDTAGIVKSFAGRLPIELISHPPAGKNRALNAGLVTAKGQFIVVTDDDSVPDGEFLRAWQEVSLMHPDHELFGGRIEPFFETTPPDWLLRMQSLFPMMFASRDLPEGPVEPGEIYGPNMAIRSSVFGRGHRFAEDIGPNGENRYYPMGSEVEFSRRISRAGVKSWFTRLALVHHIVRPHQWTEGALIDRAYRNGRGRALLRWKEGVRRRPPRVRLIDRLALVSPFTAQRFRALAVYHLARGFRDEVIHLQSQSSRPDGACRSR